MTDRTQEEAAREGERAAIRDLLHRFSRAVDRKRWSDIEAISFPDARFDYGAFQGDAAQLINWMQERHVHIERSAHLVGSTLVEFAGDRALCETYVMASQRIANPAFPSGHMDVLATGRYIDVFRKDGAWRLEQRSFVLDNSIASEAPAGDPGPMRMGRRDDADLLWTERTRLGIV